MRILFVHERFGALGGAEANAVITAGELRRKGHQVGILHGPSTGRALDRWKSVFEWRRSLGEHGPADPRSVATVLEEFRPDVVYVHKIADLGVIGALVESGRPLVRMVHDHDIYCMRSYKYFYHSRKICTRAASAFCVFGCGAFLARNHGPGLPVRYVSYREKQKELALNRQFDRVITVSEFMKGELLKNGFDPARIEIHPPVPRPGDPNLRSSFSDRNLIIYAGQIIRGKGVDVLLEALALLQVPFECIILGDGKFRARCERLMKQLRLENRVSFKGFVPQEEMKDYYRECSVIALSSVWPEPIATIGLEAMRYALPVVGFDAGGVRDWLHDGVNGYLVPWMDKRAYARALEQVLRDKEHARAMGRRGLQLVNKKYNFSNYIDGLESLFERVARERREGKSCFAHDENRTSKLTVATPPLCGVPNS